MLAATSVAHAEPVPSGPEEVLADTAKATAQELFEEGRRLMAEGRVEDACRDFAESQRLDPALGTRFNLAECYEALGKRASAWVHFVGVADTAERLGQLERAQFARARADALEPGLARMRIEVSEWVSGMVVTRNDVRIGSAQWSKSIPIDRGDYALEATAPGYAPWTETVPVLEDGITVVVQVPALAPLPAVTEVPPPVVSPPEPTADVSVGPDEPEPGPRRLDGLQRAGIVLTGLGVAGLAVGGGFGVLAIQRKDAADQRCPEPTRCFADGAQRLDQARRAGLVSTTTLVVGGVLLAAGVTMLATAPLRRRRSSSARRARLPRLVWGL